MKNNSTDSYQNGYLEAVMFVFLRNGKILVEHRLEKDKPEPFIPNGRIELKDKQGKTDYRIKALKREIKEEFQNKIKIEKFRFLTEYKVESKKIWFYVYLIEKWKGNFPRYSVENGKKSADLEWIDLKNCLSIFKLPSALFVIKKLLSLAPC